MDAVVAGCVEDPLERTKLGHNSSMDPELVDEVEVVVHDDG